MRPSAVNVEIRGLKEVSDALKAFGAEIGSAVSKAIDATALESVSDVRRAIQGPPKTGREYPRGKNGDKVHRASAPGEAPATDTGALVSSIYFNRLNDTTAAIGSRLEYAFYLEFGTLRMAARPSWVPSVEKNIPRLQKRIERIIAQAKAQAEKTTK